MKSYSTLEEDDGDGDNDGEDENGSDGENDKKQQTMTGIEFRPVGASITERLQESSFRMSK